MTTDTTFDLSGLRRAIEARDAEAMRAMYAPDAEVTIVDHVSQPSSPRVLHNEQEIGAWLDDVCSREMTHSVQQAVRGEEGAALTETCRYPDGTNVIAASVFDLTGSGQIAHQTVVQAWDEGQA